MRLGVGVIVRVGVFDGVGVMLAVGVRVPVEVTVGLRVGVGVSDRVGVLVGVAVGVRVGVSVAVAEVVAVGEEDGSGVGALPSTKKRPDFFHSNPTNICTSYSAGSHCSGLGSQSV